MRIQINDRHHRISTAGIEQTEQKLATAFAKFGYRVNRIQLTVQDVNGPRGGIDTECQVLVKLNGLGEVFASVKEDSVSLAIGHAIQRCERAVGRRVRKSHPLARHRRVGLGFVLE